MQATAPITHFTECTPVMVDGQPVHSSDRATWLEARRKLVTASDVAALLGLDPMRDPLSVYLSKRYPPKKEETLTWDDPRFWGLRLEQPIGQIVAGYLGWEFYAGGYLLQSMKHPLLGATLDAEVRPANENWRPYEGKNVSTWAANDWSLESQVPPDRVLVQGQTQMLVTGADRVQTFALLGGNQPCSIELEPHDELRDVIIEKAEELSDRLKRDDPYPATSKSTEAIKDAFPGDDGSVIDLSSEACELVERCAQLTAERRELEDEQEELRNRLRMAMGTATYGRLPQTVEVDAERAGKPVVKAFNFVKCGVTFRPAHQVAASESRSLLFVKDLPLQLQPRRRRGRR